MTNVIMRERNKLIALHHRIYDVANFELKYDKTLSSLRTPHMTYLDIHLVCESIGISKDDPIVEIISNKFEKIIYEIEETFSEYNNIVSMIKSNKFKMLGKSKLATNDKLLSKVFSIMKKFFHQKDCIMNLDLSCVDECCEMYWQQMTNQCDHDFKPYIYATKPNVRIYLEELLFRALFTNEAAYRLCEWIETKCIFGMIKDI
jgi:hypothetical protein